MPHVETTVDRSDGVTFVRAQVTNRRSTPQRVALRVQVDGPVWSPRSDTVNVSQWRGDRWEARIEPGQTVGLGFATPAAPEEPVLEVADRGRATTDDEPAAEDVISELEPARPPADVLAPDS